MNMNLWKVAEILNSLKDKVLAVKGNCDAEVDEMISEFLLQENIQMKANGYNLFVSHGHKYNIEQLPPIGIDVDIMFYGHFHVNFIEEKNGIIFVNPGSISLPKQNTEHGYAIFNEEEILLKDIEGNIIKRRKL